jgi:IS6 family transposase
VRRYLRYDLSYRDVEKLLAERGIEVDHVTGEHGPRPAEVSTDRAPMYPRVLDELLASACHVVEHYADNPIEADHGRLKSRLKPMRGLKRLRSARVISAGPAFVQNLRRGHYELGLDADPRHRLPAVFTELARAI